MAITMKETGEFWNTDKDRGTGIFAKSNRSGRWQYRIDSHKGGLVAAGMDPAAFVKRYWLRDDYEV